MSTANRVIEALSGANLRHEGGGRYRGNSPLRSDSDSKAFTLLIEDSEHGAFHDHVTQESGSLYDLAKALGVQTPRREVENTKRGYQSLDEYAQAHGITGDVLRAAKWKQVEHQGRAALEFTTKTGKRYRFIDGAKPYYKSEYGYERCWYGINARTLTLLQNGAPLVICNGEISTVTAQHYALAACCVTGGEGTLTNELVAKMADALGDIVPDIWLAFDCDKTGQDTSARFHEALTRFGYAPRALDLGLGKGGDLADLCVLHTDDVFSALQALPALTLTALALKVAQAAQTPPPPAPAEFELSAFVKTGAQTRDMYLNIIDRERFTADEGTPVAIPFKPLRTFVKAMYTGKVVLLAGATGSNKTIALETIHDGYLDIGESVMVYSPEWSPSELGQRRAVRNGGVGLETLMLHQMAKYYAARGLPVPYEDVRTLTDDEHAQSLEAASSIHNWNAESYYITRYDLDADALCEHIAQAVAAIRKTGDNLRVLFIDYMQLVELRDKDGDKITLEEAFYKIKTLAQNNDLLVWCTSQVTKASGRDANQTGRALDEYAALWLRLDKGNLAFAIAMNYFPMEPGQFDPAFCGLPDGTATIKCIKNSIGKSRGRVTIHTDLSNLRWTEDIAEDKDWHIR